ncbi:MAG: phospho-sugar mutase [Lachnospiraceae bacterium]|nr:phospho-sugar mutase [Lachnospiraceae bacterium]
MDYTESFEYWLDSLCKEEWAYELSYVQEIRSELMKIVNDEKSKEDAFYRDLSFGTAGLRGVIGAGTNRMNIFTVGRATQGLANYIVKNFAEDKRSVAISYDSRHKSDLFARVSAQVLAANGIRVHIYKELMPTPCLSFAVRELKCAAGIMVTASHNPPEYNGYKVYSPEGCQITEETADKVLSEISKTDYFMGVKVISFDEGMKSGYINYIEDKVYDDFTACVLNESVAYGENIDKNVNIIYSPLNGTGLKPVCRALEEAGYKNILVVPSQKDPDGDFPTCKYPNPENYDSMKPGMDFAKEHNADILIATDPDADRCGIAIKDKNNEYVLLTGNEIGVLLLNYICERKVSAGKMPSHPVAVKSIVSTDLAKEVGKSYGVEVKDVLTGFKYIGEAIKALEDKGCEDDYLFGFEESYGFLSGGYVRDKDAVDASFLIAEMFSFYKTKGISLNDKLNDIYGKYGYYINNVKSYEFKGSEGAKKMALIMESLRKGEMSTIGTLKVLKKTDYMEGINGLPKADVIKYELDGKSSVIVRPSGTEPKIKVYAAAVDKDKEAADKTAKMLVDELSKLMA